MASIALTDYAAQTGSPMKNGLIQKITNESLFMRILRFVPVNGFTYEYGEQSSLGSVAFRGINGSYTPDAGIVNPKVEVLSIFGGEIQTDRQLATLNNGKARVNAILAKTRRAGLFYDKYCIDGDPGSIAKSFYGLNARITGSQLITAATNGATLTLDLVDQLLDKVAGANGLKTLIMCKADARTLKQLVVAAAGGAAVMDVGQGIKKYDDATVEIIDEDGDESPILAKDETVGSSNVTSSMYCIRPGQDPEGEWVQGLMGQALIEHEAQGVRGTLYIDLIEMLGGLGVFHGRAAARLRGIL